MTSPADQVNLPLTLFIATFRPQRGMHFSHIPLQQSLSLLLHLVIVMVIVSVIVSVMVNVMVNVSVE